MRCTRLLSPAYRAGRRRTRRTEAVILPRLGTVPRGARCGAYRKSRTGCHAFVQPPARFFADCLPIRRCSPPIQGRIPPIQWRPGALAARSACVLAGGRVGSLAFGIAPAARQLGPEPHASLPLFPAHPARDAEGGGDRLASADAARRHDPPAGGGHLLLAAARPAGAEQDQPHRPRGAEPLRRDRAPDADRSSRPISGAKAGATTPTARRCCASRTGTSATCCTGRPTRR